ncbi:T9SS type A sorting domain-containing protein [Flavobacterium franklandianum]|uniref:T9SS type A sorting domain-containing protein n=1 Tax=Flavobacterium franklandianum TaxID=2594430 RepID=A0A553CJ22_9FLAO|nr:T9SS type A sorting domain-containing protein [Flavobacterium franklandianum]TRX20470.1 T9SS type A sorting domain-containing protein [Flavobacterium franklandianum]
MKHLKKSITISILYLAMVYMQTAYSQVIENYEGTPINMTILNGGSTDLSTLTVISNPYKTGINTSNKVCYLLRDKDGIPEVGFWATKTIDFTTNKYIHVKVYKTRITTVKFKVEDRMGGILEMTSSNPQTKVNQWEDLVFDFSSLTGNYTKISLMPDFIDPVGLSADINIYFDDIILNNNPNPITFIDELFQNSYMLYKNIRKSNGVYLDALALNGAGAKPAAIAANGIGLMSLCIADAMYVKTGDAINWEATANQVIATTQTFIDFKNNGKINGAGMFPRYFRWDNGSQEGSWPYEYSTIDNAIFAMGLQMCKNYFSNNATIVSNVNILLGAMDYTKAIYPTQIAMILDQSGNNGSAFTNPFNEYMLVAWLAKNTNSSNSGSAKSQLFWNTYFANPTTAPIARPNYAGYVTLSDGGYLSCFIPQFCYYFVNMFKNDSNYMSYFNNWLNADKLYATNNGTPNSFEWGLGAGEIPGGGYSADKINDNPNKIVSPHIISGFSPIYSNTKSNLLSLYNNGNGASIYSLPSNSAKKVLWRYKRNDTVARASYIQAIDYCTMLFGLASLPENLGDNWFSKYNWPLDLQALSVDDFSNKSDNILVYPNPFDDKIIISFKEKTIAEIHIFDVLGKQILATKIINFTETIDLPKQLQSGLYILELKINNETFRIKIVKK